MRVLFDARPERACLTGIGRYAQTLARLLRDVPRHDCWGLGTDLTFRVSSAADEAIALPVLLERELVDLFHSPLVHLPPVLPCAAAVTLHDAIPARRPDLTTDAFRRVFEDAPEAARRAAGVICPSEHAKGEVAADLDLDPARVHVVPETPWAGLRPLDPDERTAVRSRYGLAPAQPVLLTVGTSERRKNQTLVLDALRCLPEEVVALFVGPPGNVDLPGAIEQAGLQSRARHLGVLTDADLAALYGAVTGVVVPSLYEGFGLPVVEGLAAGVPVLAADAASLPEVVGEAGRLFSPEDPEDLAARVRELLDDPDLAGRLVAAGHERLARHFSPSAVQTALATVYDALEGSLRHAPLV